ncbi:MAG: methyltransferase family protein [Planctomycetota bacterium]
MALLLFLSAGRWNWGMGWALVGIVLAWASVTAWILIHCHPELLPERMGSLRGAKAWDKAILGSIGLTTVARCVVAGLDQRWGWSTGMPPSALVAATAAAMLGYALVVWATLSNAFFSQIVRIQVERGHAVATRGPYRFVRHPAYVGTVLFELAAPVMLGSWYWQRSSSSYAPHSRTARCARSWMAIDRMPLACVTACFRAFGDRGTRPVPTACEKRAWFESYD